MRCEGKQWRVRCDCGAEKLVSTPNLRTGRSQSCGCLRDELAVPRATRHGKYYTREYRIWNSAKGRCRVPSHTSYPWYGARGIQMCDRWADDFTKFYEDMGPCPPGYSIERTNPDGNYEPANCLWIPRSEQSKNRAGVRYLEFNGERLILADWARRFGISHTTLIKHLKRRPFEEIAARYHR